MSFECCIDCVNPLSVCLNSFSPSEVWAVNSNNLTGGKNCEWVINYGTMVWREAIECNLWIRSWPTVPFAWYWGTKLRFQWSIEKQLQGKANASKSKGATHTFIINYPSFLQSLEEMIALVSLISIPSLSLPCVVLFLFFSFLLYFILSLSIFTSVCDSKAQMHTIIRVYLIVKSHLPWAWLPHCHLGEFLSLCI